jgi:hypothetical protein
VIYRGKHPSDRAHVGVACPGHEEVLYPCSGGCCHLWPSTMFHVQYHGYVGIDAWEYFLSLAYLVVLYLYFARKKSQRIRQEPEYAHLLWGLFAKVLAGTFFSLIYFYYYKGGDTIAYFYSAVSMSKLLKLDPVSYFTVLFGENNMENRSFFNFSTGYPFGYVYFDNRTFFIIRCISPIVYLCMDSYLVTTVVLASLSYLAIWPLYRTFVSYFPDIQGKLAIAILYMPSTNFWGSAILKDTFTLSAVCLWVYCVDELFFKKRFGVIKLLILLLSAYVILMVKPYIFMVLFPCTLLWLFYPRVLRIRNALVKFVVVPFVFTGLLVASFSVLLRLEGSLGKFSLQNAITTIEVNQLDMKRSEQYGANYFDLGEMDGTWTGVMGKFHVAATAGLFRPFLWETRNAVMALSGLENAWVLGLVLITLMRAGPLFFLRCIGSLPILLMSFLFSLLFAFLVGATTPNFGALVRFKIPLIPFFVASMYIVQQLVRIKREKAMIGENIIMSDYTAGIKAGSTTTRKLKPGQRRKSTRS